MHNFRNKNNSLERNLTTVELSCYVKVLQKLCVTNVPLLIYQSYGIVTVTLLSKFKGVEKHTLLICLNLSFNFHFESFQSMSEFYEPYSDLFLN